MNYRKKIAVVGCWATLFLAGCWSVDYVGQRFEPISEDVVVEVFTEKNDEIKDNYAVIGQAVVNSSEDLSEYQIRKAMIAKAKEVGAEAVLIVDARLAGNNGITLTDAYVESLADEYRRAFGAVSPLNTVNRDTQVVICKAFFLVNKEKFETFMQDKKAEREQFLRDQSELMRTPAPLPPQR